MSRALALAALAAASCIPPATASPLAATRTVLVELFTSQGCSSCPAADAFVRELPSLGLPRARVVPLTFHVDYWNNLGWRDPFSLPTFTERQQRYVESGHLRGPDGQDSLSGLYTPQTIVFDGAVHFSGRRRDVALAEIRRAAEAAPLVDLLATATASGAAAQVTARVTARAPSPSTGEWRVWVAVAARAARTHVTRGENGGETLDEAAVVRALSPPVAVSLAPDAPPARLTVARPADLPWSDVELAVVVQSATTLQVAAAQSLTIQDAGRGEPR